LISKSSIEVIEETSLQALWVEEQTLTTPLLEFKKGRLNMIENQ